MLILILMSMLIWGLIVTVAVLVTGFVHVVVVIVVISRDAFY
jgi:hypothetical protein